MRIEFIRERPINERKGEERTIKFYKLGRYGVKVTTYGDGERFIFVDKDLTEKYLPDIHFHSDYGKPEEFTIQTTSYGGCNIDEMKKVIEGYEYAIDVVKVLTDTFIK